MQNSKRRTNNVYTNTFWERGDLLPFMVVRGKMLGVVNGMWLIYRLYFVTRNKIKPVYEPHTNRQLWKAF